MTLPPHATLTVGVLREQAADEQRVGLTPDSAARLVAAGHPVVVETGAGAHAWFADAEYEAAGATVAPRAGVLDASDLVVCLHPSAVLHALSPKHVVLGLLQPLLDPQLMQRMAEAGVTALSFDMLPRTVSRAQSMDALTSQASVAGYKAVLVAAAAYPAWFPMLTTAAGTSRPAAVLVLGCGVAGLQAIGTARRLGAVVSAYDVRAAARDEAASVGARWLDLDSTDSAPGGGATDGDTTDVALDGTGAGGYARELAAEQARAQQERLAARIGGFDVVITTAQVPGRRPPLLVTDGAVKALRPGSVVVDLAAGPAGGNVEGVVADTTVVTEQGVTVIGAGSLPATVPVAASTAYSRNLAALLGLLVHDGAVHLDPADEIVSALRVTPGGAS